jgi:hypothetical protein
MVEPLGKMKHGVPYERIEFKDVRGDLCSLEWDYAFKRITLRAHEDINGEIFLDRDRLVRLMAHLQALLDTRMGSLKLPPTS